MITRKGKNNLQRPNKRKNDRKRLRFTTFVSLACVPPLPGLFVVSRNRCLISVCSYSEYPSFSNETPVERFELLDKVSQTSTFCQVPVWKLRIVGMYQWSIMSFCVNSDPECKFLFGGSRLILAVEVDHLYQSLIQLLLLSYCC